MHRPHFSRFTTHPFFVFDLSIENLSKPFMGSYLRVQVHKLKKKESWTSVTRSYRIYSVSFNKIYKSVSLLIDYLRNTLNKNRSTTCSQFQRQESLEYQKVLSFNSVSCKLQTILSPMLSLFLSHITRVSTLHIKSYF